MVKHHGIHVTAPYYAASNDGTMLHRYLDDQFIDRYQRDASTTISSTFGKQLIP